MDTTVTEEKVLKAIKSIRKLKRVGECDVGLVAFEYPTAEQIMRMPRDKPFEVCTLRWQIDKTHPYWVGSIGITHINGGQSPMFTGLNANRLSAIKELDIPIDGSI